MLLDWAEAPAGGAVHGPRRRASPGRAGPTSCARRSSSAPSRTTSASPTPTEGRELVAAAGTGATLPIIVFPDGTVLENPTNAEIAVAAGSPVSPETMDFDVVIVGAGPAGLSAAVYGASEGFSTLVVDKGGIGGQATSSSLIRNYLGFPRGLSGRQLARRAYDQAWVFGAELRLHADRHRPGARGRPPARRRCRTAARCGRQPCSWPWGPATAGSGCRRSRRLTAPASTTAAPTSEAAGLVGREVFIVGGANSAGQAALHLARYAKQRHARGPGRVPPRRDVGVPRPRGRSDADNIEVRTETEVVGGGGDGRLEHLVLRDVATGSEVTVEAQALFLLIGARPFTSWLPSTIERDDQGVHPDRPRGRRRRRLAARAPPVSPRDEHAGRVRGRRRAARRGEAGRVRGGRRFHRRPVPPRAPRHRVALAAAHGHFPFIDERKVASRRSLRVGQVRCDQASTVSQPNSSGMTSWMDSEKFQRCPARSSTV